MKKKSILPVSVIGAVLLAVFTGLTPGAPEPVQGDAGYIGSEQCCSCHAGLHPGIVNEWQASTHHRTMKAGSPGKDLSSNPSIDPALEKKDISAVIGHEDSVYAFVGTDFQVFQSEGFGIKEPFPPHDEIGREGEKTDAGRLCFGCHATGYSVSRKKYAEPGVACEACHGPGKKHLDSGGSKGTIVNPSRLPPEGNRMVCGQCHSLGKDPSGQHPFPVMTGGEPFKPGDDLTLGFVDDNPVIVTRGAEYSTFVHSPRPYSDQLCTDCHEPHGKAGNPAMLKSPTSALCLRCHGNPLSGVMQVDEKRHWGAYKHTCWLCHEYAHLH
ncbi:MAG TPA: cytochrome c3 family protein [archaeon]|nr:cytochrome c3 family protein [archaeon]